MNPARALSMPVWLTHAAVHFCIRYTNIHILYAGCTNMHETGTRALAQVPVVSLGMHAVIWRSESVRIYAVCLRFGAVKIVKPVWVSKQ